MAYSIRGFHLSVGSNLRLLWICIRRLAIGLKNSCHFLSQSEVKPKPIVSRSHLFPCALRVSHMYLLCIWLDSLTGLSVFLISNPDLPRLATDRERSWYEITGFFVSGQCDYIWFWFCKSQLKPLSYMFSVFGYYLLWSKIRGIHTNDQLINIVSLLPFSLLQRLRQKCSFMSARWLMVCLFSLGRTFAAQSPAGLGLYLPWKKKFFK